MTENGKGWLQFVIMSPHLLFDIQKTFANRGQFWTKKKIEYFSSLVLYSKRECLYNYLTLLFYKGTGHFSVAILTFDFESPRE
jgi:hypothetical protein